MDILSTVYQSVFAEVSYTISAYQEENAKAKVEEIKKLFNDKDYIAPYAYTLGANEYISDLCQSLKALNGRVRKEHLTLVEIGEQIQEKASQTIELVNSSKQNELNEFYTDGVEVDIRIDAYNDNELALVFVFKGKNKCFVGWSNDADEFEFPVVNGSLDSDYFIDLVDKAVDVLQLYELTTSEEYRNNKNHIFCNDWYFEQDDELVEIAYDEYYKTAELGYD